MYLISNFLNLIIVMYTLLYFFYQCYFPCFSAIWVCQIILIFFKVSFTYLLNKRLSLFSMFPVSLIFKSLWPSWSRFLPIVRYFYTSIIRPKKFSRIQATEFPKQRQKNPWSSLPNTTNPASGVSIPLNYVCDILHQLLSLSTELESSLCTVIDSYNVWLLIAANVWL